MDLLKLSLIDLETQAWVTGRKQAKAVQRERLSERAAEMPMRQSDLPYNAQKKWERESERILRLKRGHKSNRMWGYHSAVRVKSSTTATGAVAKGSALAGCVTAYYALSNTPDTGTHANCHIKGIALAAQALYTTTATAVFIQCL